MKSKTILCLALVLSGIVSVFGVSVEIPVTPDSLDQGDYAFSVSTNATQGGILFHIAITAKTNAIFPDSTVGLCIVSHTTNSAMIEAAKPSIQLALNKDVHIWKANFVMPNELLAKQNLCFVFTAYGHAVVNGRIIAMPSAIFYEIKLQVCLKQL